MEDYKVAYPSKYVLSWIRIPVVGSGRKICWNSSRISESWQRIVSLPLILWPLKCQVCLCRGDPEAVEIVFSDIQRLDPLEFLNDTVIDFYIKYVWPTSFQLTSEYLFRVYTFAIFFLICTSATCFLEFVTRYLHVDAPMYLSCICDNLAAWNLLVGISWVDSLHMTRVVTTSSVNCFLVENIVYVVQSTWVMYRYIQRPDFLGAKAKHRFHFFNTFFYKKLCEVVSSQVGFRCI